MCHSFIGFITPPHFVFQVHSSVSERSQWTVDPYQRAYPGPAITTDTSTQLSSVSFSTVSDSQPESNSCKLACCQSPPHPCVLPPHHKVSWIHPLQHLFLRFHAHILIQSSQSASSGQCRRELPAHPRKPPATDTCQEYSGSGTDQQWEH